MLFSLAIIDGKSYYQYESEATVLKHVWHAFLAQDEACELVVAQLLGSSITIDRRLVNTNNYQTAWRGPEDFGGGLPDADKAMSS